MGPGSTTVALQTHRLSLRNPVIGDKFAIFDALQSPLFPRQIPLGQINSLEDVQRWLERCRQLPLENRGNSWIITAWETQTIVGQITLSLRRESEHLALAFWIHPDYWDCGYATEAAERVVLFAFKEMGAKSIWAAAATWNQASQRVLEKLGFEFQNENPIGYQIQEKPVPTREYEMNREQWQLRVPHAL